MTIRKAALGLLTFGLAIAFAGQTQAQLAIDVTGVPGSGETTWSFSGEYTVVRERDSQLWYELGHFASDAQHNNVWRPLLSGGTATVEGSTSGTRPITYIYLDSDGSPGVVGSDDFGFLAAGLFVQGETLVFSGSSTMPFDINTFDEIASFPAELTSNTDGISLSLSFSVESTNDPPMANAGADQSIHAGDTVSLDGSATDDDNTEPALLDYAWAITSKPVGSDAVLTDANTVAPSFEADLTGDYVIELLVTDDEGLSSSDSVTISSNNQAPTAVTGINAEGLAFVGDTVTFDGSGSFDPDGDQVYYSWTLAAPAGSAATLGGADTATPTLTLDVPGTYEVSLEVSDFLGPGAELAVVEITATTAESFAESLIIDACETVAALDNSQVTSKGNRNAFCKQLANAVESLQEGETAVAIKKLNKVLSRTDGHLQGSVDGNGKGRDWITDLSAQELVYDSLALAIETLE